MRTFGWFSTLILAVWVVTSCAGEGARCGDGVKDSDEECDDGNREAGDGCSAVCRNEGWCGNQICENGEAHTCPTDCPVCGNDQCDETESVATCTVDCYCTNGTCDDGETSSICPQDCPIIPVCGNSDCEDGESISLCLADCYCTNGTCDSGETETTCPQDCALSPCGDGTCAPTESLTSCAEDCYCTNGTCDTGENATICPQDCTTPPTCGNGQLDTGEPCDGNNLGGKTCLSQGFDGGMLSCNANCTLNTAACTTAVGCTIVPQSGCTAGDKCTVDTAAANRCISAGAGTDGTPCGADADCAAGLGCAVVNAFTQEGACRRFCRDKTAFYDSLDCSAGAGSTCYYGVSDASNTVIPNLFQCTANCDPLTGNGCLASMKCNLYGVDRTGDYVADLFTSECYATADSNYFCEGATPCPQGFECFDFGYGQACYRWCSNQNTYTCTPLGMVCKILPDRPVLGGVEYGYCDYEY